MKSRPSASSLGAQKIASRLTRARTPSARLYAKYREWIDLYLDSHPGQRAILRLPGGHEVSAELGFRRSILFRRDYLVAWVDDGVAFKRAMPAMDAIMSPVLVSWMPVPLPLIVAPASRKRRRTERFVSVIEHEIVHANQAIQGLRIPELKAASARELLEYFFTVAHLEHEAHFIQSVRWPPPLKFGKVTLTLGQWVLLRAYTPAIEDILRGTAVGRIPKRIVSGFLDDVPKRAPARLGRIGCAPELVSWFKTRWAIDVFIALRVLQSQGIDSQGAPLRRVWEWLRDQPALRRDPSK